MPSPSDSEETRDERLDKILPGGQPVAGSASPW